jgi:hypothetical protein
LWVKPTFLLGRRSVLKSDKLSEVMPPPSPREGNSTSDWVNTSRKASTRASGSIPPALSLALDLEPRQVSVQDLGGDGRDGGSALAGQEPEPIVDVVG